MVAQYDFYQADAFADGPLLGNPAAVMPMDAFPDAAVMQAIAAENNLAETAFLVRTGDDGWDLRWFTPAVEVPLCGHATLAAAHVLFNHCGFDGDTVRFATQSGELTVSRMADGRLEMDFPVTKTSPLPAPDLIDRAAARIGVTPEGMWSCGMFLLVQLGGEDEVRALRIAPRQVVALHEDMCGGPGNAIFSAAGDSTHDVVSRVFAPGAGIDEDPVTGSAHCAIAPIFSSLLQKQTLSCFQAYPGRGGVVETQMAGERVKLRGRAVTVIEGRFSL